MIIKYFNLSIYELKFLGWLGKKCWGDNYINYCLKNKLNRIIFMDLGGSHLYERVTCNISLM